MFANRVFLAALIISVTAHGLILLQNTHFPHFLRQKKEEKIELSYIKQPEKEVPPEKPQPLKKEPFLKLPAKITADKLLSFAKREKINKNNRQFSQDARFNLNRPTLIKPDIIAIKKKITIPPIEINKINNPAYINYYQVVREKIRRAAYHNYLRIEIGEVYLSFVVSHDGLVKEMRLNEDKSSPNLYLHQTALNSIKDASPFPGFPKELDYPQLSFNVVISFEIE